MDLIERQKAIDALAEFVPYVIDDVSTESYTNGLTDAYNLICQLPPAQPEIIRCKDCLKYDAHGHRCKHWNHAVVVMDWCSRAERKEE